MKQGQVALTFLGRRFRAILAISILLVSMAEAVSASSAIRALTGAQL